MMPHPAWSLLFITLLSGAAAMSGDRPARERACAAAYTFVSCTFAIVAGSWAMYFIHG